MNTVQPIKDLAKIEQLKKVLLNRSSRDYMFFVIGVNTGFRISDILKLKVSHVKGQSHITVREKKTNKEKKALINAMLRVEIDRYIQGMSEDEYLFRSQKGVNKPISRVQAYRILNEAAIEFGFNEIGTHTIRKTFGYWHYKRHNDIALLQKHFNHSSPSITLRYIGIDQDMMDQAMENFFI